MFDGINLTSDGKRVQKELKELEKLLVAVGFPNGTPQKIIDRAAYNELGTLHIPARPFLRDSLNLHKEEYNQFMAALIRGIMNGGTAKQALEDLGVYAKGVVQEQIRDGSYEANCDVTIKRKGSSVPLIDTGEMEMSVNYQVRKKG